MDISALLAEADSLLAVHVENPKLEAGDTSQAASTPKVKTIRAKVSKVPAPATLAAAQAAGVVPAASMGVLLDLQNPDDAAEYLRLEKLVGFRQSISPVTGAPLCNAKRQPVIYRNPAEVMNDQRVLMQCCGFDPRELGASLSAANRRARLTLDASLGGDGVKLRPSNTIAGFVAGMPAPAVRLLADMKAKQKTLIDAASKLNDAGNVTLANKLLAQAQVIGTNIESFES